LLTKRGSCLQNEVQNERIDVSSAVEAKSLDRRQLESGRLARQAAQGAAALFVRQGLVYGSNIAGGVILSRMLTPAEFGFYGVVLFFVVFLNIFGGTGFAANLIRTEEYPSLADFRAVFTAQQAVVGLIFLGVWAVAPWLASHYHMEHNGSAFFRLIGVALVLTSLMVISQVLMERELAFSKLAVVEVAQALTFNLAAIVLAWRGVGVLSFSIALVMRAACGALLSNAMEPWSMGWLWDSTVLKRHIRYGLALQGGQFISLAKDSITPIFVGLHLGAAKMGYVTWAATLAGYPTMMLTPLQRLYLPFFARLQSDRKELRRYATHAMWMANAFAAPLVVTTVALAHPITVMIFASKWLVALPLFYCLAIANVLASGSAPMLGLLNATGKSHVTLMLAIVWMITTWAFGVPLMMKFGMIGFGIAVIAVQITNIGLYWVIWREVSLSVLPTYWPCWPVAIAIGSLMLLLQRIWPICEIATLAAYVFVGLIAYATILWFGFPRQTRILGRIIKQAA
jgi:O-antigen/teichoic acid export membrane protein